MSSSDNANPQDRTTRRDTATLSPTAAVNAIAGIMLCFAAAVVLLVHGSVYAVAFFVLGIFYLMWFSGVPVHRSQLAGGHRRGPRLDNGDSRRSAFARIRYG